MSKASSKVQQYLETVDLTKKLVKISKVICLKDVELL